MSESPQYTQPFVWQNPAQGEKYDLMLDRFNFHIEKRLTNLPAGK
jgi:hypothetical protein